MEPVQLFDLASRKTAWLAARQATIASNVANANTPGYHAKDVAPFADVMAKTQLELASTSDSHLSLGDVGGSGAAGTSEDPAPFEVSETGNNVGVEAEMIKAGDVNRDFAMTTNVVKAFHAMLMASLKG